ncbi:MAG: hypothetical protein AB8G96_15370 [Phycisphaerales bacterium]
MLIQLLLALFSLLSAHEPPSDSAAPSAPKADGHITRVAPLMADAPTMTTTPIGQLIPDEQSMRPSTPNRRPRHAEGRTASQDDRRNDRRNERRSTPIADHPQAVGDAGVAWYTTWESGLAEAKRSNRPIFFMAAATCTSGVPGTF